jgi:pimeloyl-ACP methyl ester carboxylesterase
MAGDTVVLVHGLWMNGAEMAVLGRRLRHEHDFDVRTFAYPTLHGETADACRRLADFAWTVNRDPDRVHLVGHSLGGVLVHRMLSTFGTGFRGNSVLLAAPLNGSRAAAGAARWPALRPLLGPLVLDELTRLEPRAWNGPAALGAIAGTLRAGTGQFFAHFDEDNDGTVAVSETRVEGLADHLVVSHSHIGMLFAQDIARQVAHFLEHGVFQRAAA